MQSSFPAISGRIPSRFIALVVCIFATVLLISCKRETASEERSKTAPAGTASTPPALPGETASEGRSKTAPDLSSPKKAALAFAKAVRANDIETVRQACTGTDAQLASTFAAIDAAMDEEAAMKRYDAAGAREFGDAWKFNPKGLYDRGADVEKFEETIGGDRATLIDKEIPDVVNGKKTPDFSDAEIPDLKNPARMTLEKKGGNWKVDLSSMPTDDAKIRKSAKMVVDAIDAMTKDLQARKYKTPRKAIEALMAARWPLHGLNNDPLHQAAQEENPDVRTRDWSHYKGPAVELTEGAFGPPGGTGIGPKGPVFGAGRNARRIAFVCDASGSMINKMATLKDQLSKTVVGLRPIQSFEIIFFQDEKFDSFIKYDHKDTLVVATPEAKRVMSKFLEGVTTTGSTDPIPGIEAAFKTKPQLIYLLTGSEFRDNDAVLKKIRELNKDQNPKIRINTIAFAGIGDNDTAFLDLLRTIASETGGNFRSVKESDL